jgi:hypothetical protein
MADKAGSVAQEGQAVRAAVVLGHVFACILLETAGMAAAAVTAVAAVGAAEVRHSASTPGM